MSDTSIPYIVRSGKLTQTEYAHLHRWVYKNLGAPKVCQYCGDAGRNRYDWANVSQEYKRELTDWIRLCRSCHAKKDKLYRLEQDPYYQRMLKDIDETMTEDFVNKFDAIFKREQEEKLRDRALLKVLKVAREQGFIIVGLMDTTNSGGDELLVTNVKRKYGVNVSNGVLPLSVFTQWMNKRNE
jgi:hypothetical protein